jgi:hypothetical protein
VEGEETPGKSQTAGHGAKGRGRIADQQEGRDHGSHRLAEAHGPGFASILASKGGDKIDSSKNAAGERTYSIAK